jgi:hypothetical protein
MQIGFPQTRTLQCLPLRWARTFGDRSFEWLRHLPSLKVERIIVDDAPATWQDLSPQATADKR